MKQLLFGLLPVMGFSSDRNRINNNGSNNNKRTEKRKDDNNHLQDNKYFR